MSYTDLASDGIPGAEEELAPDTEGLTDEEKQPDQDEVRSAHQKLIEWSRKDNIADDLDDDVLSKLGSLVKREYQVDEDSRSDWVAKSRTAMDLAMQVAKEKSYPWPKSSNVIFPLMTTAAVQFAARAYPAIVSGRNVVKGVVVGADDGTPQIGQDGQPIVQPDQNGQPQIVWKEPPGAKRSRADRIGDHMSWQLLEEQEEWEEETDRLLHLLPILGCCFRKSWFDAGEGCNASFLASPFNVVVNYKAKSLARAPRITEKIQLYPIEIEENIRSGLYVDQEYTAMGEAAGDDDAPVDFLEQHRRYDLDDDGYAEPYIVTVHEHTGKVARIVARYDPEGIKVRRNGEIARIEAVQYYTKYDFMPNTDDGIYGMGFGQLLSPINEAVNTTLNMLLDAGHLSNTQSGFVGKHLSMHSGSLRFKMGQFNVVNAPGGAIRDSIVPMQWPGPSPVLFQLLGLLIDAGKDIASVKDILSGDANMANMQPTTVLALIDQGLKVFTAIYKRVHRAAAREYEKLYRLNRVYLDERAQYQVGDEWREITREDYAKGSGVAPISDPSMVSNMQKLGRAQFLMQFMADPAFDGLEIRRRVMDAADIDQPDALFAKPQPPPPPPPQLVLEGLKLEQRGIEVEADRNLKKAQEVERLSAAMKNMAEVDKIVSEDQRAWTGQQWEILKGMYEALVAGDGKPQMPGMPGMKKPGEPPDGEGGAAPAEPPLGPLPMMPGQLEPVQ